MMKIRPAVLLGLPVFVLCLIVGAASSAQLTTQNDVPFAAIPTEQRSVLSKRLAGYVEAHKGRNWENLFAFVSDAGKGGTSQKVFVADMKAARGSAVFERQDWYFTGWTFTDFPNTPCKKLANPKWQPEERQTWKTPMQEIKDANQSDIPARVDSPH
jgi:hypothetical protein